MKSILKGIKKIDLFGYKIEINFNRKGSNHRTIFGGCLSILYAIVILAFAILGFTNI